MCTADNNSQHLDDIGVVTYGQVSTPGFPLHAFHMLVEYERQAASGVPETAQAALAAAPCARHVQLDVHLDWLSDARQQPPAAQEESHVHEGASVGSPAREGARGASSPAPPASPQSAARVEPAAPDTGEIHHCICRQLTFMILFH